MAAAIGNLISRTDYNTIQSDINSVLGTGDGAQTGYGRTLQSSQINSAKVIESEDMLALYNDLVKARTHQKGSLQWTGDGLNSPSDAELIGYDAADIGTDGTSATATNDTTEGFDDFIDATADIVQDHDLAANSQLSLGVPVLSTKTASWGGNDQSFPGTSINHTVVVTWTNADERRYFFNSGGTIIFDSIVDGSWTVGTKNEVWQTMMSNLDIVSFGKNSTTSSGTSPGNPASNIGNYYASWSSTSSSNPVQIFTKNGTGVYSDNSYSIYAWETASNSLRFNIVFQDGDIGTATTAPDTPVDEFVTADITSSVKTKYASTLGIPAPTVTNVSLL